MMPIMSKTYRKAFKWRELNGLPVAEVIELNGRLWCFACPACGCLHELIGGALGQPFALDCLLRRLASMPSAPSVHRGANWRRVLADWHALYPGAASANTVLLLDEAAVAALDKEQRKAAAAAKRAAAKQTTENTMPMERKTA